MKFSLSELSLAKQDVMSLPGASRVGTVAAPIRSKPPRPPNGNLLVSRPRGSPGDSYPDLKGDSFWTER